MNRTVTIPLAEYEALLAAREDLEDLRAYDEASVREGARFPEAVVERILDGESPVRVFRKWRAITQERLALQAGVNRVTVAELESGRKAGSVRTLKAVAEALGVAVDDLI